MVIHLSKHECKHILLHQELNHGSTHTVFRRTFKTFIVWEFKTSKTRTRECVCLVVNLCQWRASGDWRGSAVCCSVSLRQLNVSAPWERRRADSLLSVTKSLAVQGKCRSPVKCAALWCMNNSHLLEAVWLEVVGWGEWEESLLVKRIKLNTKLQ